MVTGIPKPPSSLAWIVAHPDGGHRGRQEARRVLEQIARGEPLPEQLVDVMNTRLDNVYSRLTELGWVWIPFDKPEFPPGLQNLQDPPLGLFCCGQLPVGPAVAIVGARRATAYGREVAEYLGRELAQAGVWVISGMARGVDAAAHRGALIASGKTAAVWGAGPDHIYPREHDGLAREIAAQGCLLTEYPPGEPPQGHHFPERNRLIAGLASIVVVVEADERSGALITARLALDEGREVMAVPGSVFSRLSAGPNGLLRAGAAPVITAGDILSVLGIEASKDSSREVESQLLAAFGPGEAVTVDHLAAVTSWPISQVLESLLTLEIASKVVREIDGRYRRSGLNRSS